MQCPKAAIFDLDDTLAESFKRPSDEVLGKLLQLLERIPVAIMTGSSLKRMEAQFLSVLTDSPQIGRFYLFPNSSAQCFSYDGSLWAPLYDLSLTDTERDRIIKAIRDAVDHLPDIRAITPQGQQLFDRGAQIAYTPVGVDATLEEKRAWDPDGTKRAALISALKAALPEFEVLLGGTTTVDVTRKGINKAHGVHWLSERLKVAPEEMFYVGDAFDEQGNDRVVISTGVVTRAVSGPEETPRVLDELLSACA